VSFAEYLALERLPSEAGSAVLRARVGPEHVNMHGSAHGGFLYSLADEAFAIASNSREADAVALSVHMDYFRAVFPGDLLVASAREEHLGRSVATYRVEVTRVAVTNPEVPYPDVAHPGVSHPGVSHPARSGPREAGGDAAAPAGDRPARREAAQAGPADDGPDDADGPGAVTVALFTGTVYRRPRRTEAG